MSVLKICKGTGKAKGSGCGKQLEYAVRGNMKLYFQKYGLGTIGCRCFYNWFESPEPIKKVSNKRKVENREYSKLRKQFLSENQICFIEWCTKIADTIEHTKGRKGYADDWARQNKISLLLDKRFWKPCCLEHNLELETNIELSKKYQLSKIHGGEKI